MKHTIFHSMIAGDVKSRIHAYCDACGGDDQANDLAEEIQVPVVGWIIEIRNDTWRRLQSGAGWTHKGRSQTFWSQHVDELRGAQQPYDKLNLLGGTWGGLNTG